MTIAGRCEWAGHLAVGAQPSGNSLTYGYGAGLSDHPHAMENMQRRAGWKNGHGRHNSPRRGQV